VFRRSVVALVAFALVVATALIVRKAAPADAASIRKPLRAAVGLLPVAAEHRDGYERSLFRHWVDKDRDGCDTRREVLLAEAVEKPRRGASCALTGGRWFSYYDGKYVRNASNLDIDHLVPLAEAWDSGARNWTGEQREAYANDIGDARALVAVTSSVNRSKGDRDPTDWLPPQSAARCRYTEQWVAVKLRWKLRVDATERAALINLALRCPNHTISVRIAPIASSQPTPTSVPTKCSSAYPDFCVPPPPPDLDCADVAPHRNFTARPPDPHGFDGDGDGRGCES
jgi:hypothetical protein